MLRARVASNLKYLDTNLPPKPKRMVHYVPKILGWNIGKPVSNYFPTVMCAYCIDRLSFLCSACKYSVKLYKRPGLSRHHRPTVCCCLALLLVFASAFSPPSVDKGYLQIFQLTTHGGEPYSSRYRASAQREKSHCR